MAKYEKYVRVNPIDHDAKLYSPNNYGPTVWYRGDVDFNNNFTMSFRRVSRDIVMEPIPHTHDFDMYLWVISYDPDNMGELGCEVELCYGLGEEREVYILTETGGFFVPSGVAHGPLTIRKVTRPILFVHTLNSDHYYQTETFT